MNPTPFSPPQPWVCAGGDGTRRGLFSRPVRINGQPWRRLPARGAVQTSVVFDAEDRCFVTDMAGRVQAFRSDGTALWHVDLDGPISATPAVDPVAKRLYVGTNTGQISALGTEDGRTVWQRRLPSGSDPRILSDLLIVPATDVVMTSSWGGHFHAIDGASGETRKTWDAGISPQSGLTAAGQDQIYGLRAVTDRGIELIRLKLDGTETVLHREPEAQRPAQRMLVAAAPVLDPWRDRAYAVMNRNGAARLLAWSVAEERMLWAHELPAAVAATPTVRQDGMIWIGDLEGGLHGIQPDGERGFSYFTGSEYLLAGGVADMGNTLYHGDTWGQLHVLQSDGDGGMIFEAGRALQARPSFDRHGNLYLPGTDHLVHVFRNGADSPGTPRVS
jgi:outer membrane protein assembly factor BamB